MSLIKENKPNLVKEYGLHDKDTGSPEVQIALLTDRISNLTRHFQAFAHDNNSKRGLLKLVGRRKRLLRYLHKTDLGRYKKLIQGLGIRGSF